MKKLILIAFAVLTLWAGQSKAQTVTQLKTYAASFPLMPRSSADLIPYISGGPANLTFASGFPANDVEWTLFDTDYMEGETNGYDVFCPVDPGDTYPGSNTVKLIVCVSTLNTDASFGGDRGDRIILGADNHPNPFFLMGADSIDNDYLVIMNFDFNYGHIQLKGQASDYRLVYCTLADGVATEGWYLIYRKDFPLYGQMDLIAFIYPCWDINNDNSPSTPTNPNQMCNADSSLQLLNPTHFKFAQPISSTPTIPNGIIQFGSSGKEIVSGTTVDDEGYLYVFGNTDGNLDNGANPANEMFVAKYNPNGTQVWIREFGDRNGALIFDAVTDSNYVYAAGRTFGALPGFTNNGKWDAIIVKFDKTTGVIVDTDQWGNSGIDGYGSITLDDAGNLFVSGAGSPAITTPDDSLFVVAKHSCATLNNIWRNLDPVLPTTKVAEAWCGVTYIPVIAPGNGKLVVGGWVSNPPQGSNGFLALYGNLNNASPIRLNQQMIGTQNQKADWIMDNAADNNGNIFGVGYTTGNLQGTHQGKGDAFIVKYDSNLNNPIFKQIGTSSTDLFRNVKVDANGFVYAIGYTYGDYNGANQDATKLTGDIIVLKFDNSLNLINSVQFGSPNEDRGNFWLKDTILYVGGMTEGSIVNSNLGSFDAFTLALSTSNLSILQPSLTTSIIETTNKSLIEIYPNPAKSAVTIAGLDGDFNGAIFIFNNIGQMIKTEHRTGSQVSIEIGNLKSGIYFIHIKTEKGEVITRKFIKE
jgi:hypothetical protein